MKVEVNVGTERWKLIVKLRKILWTVDKHNDTWIDNLADFIIEDRKRIVKKIIEPLRGIDEVDLTTAEKQILKNAGLE